MFKGSTFRIIPVIVVAVCVLVSILVVWHGNVGNTGRLRWTKNTVHYISNDTNIIFDLNDTLFTLDKRKALSCLGVGDVMLYFLSGHRSTDLEDKLFAIIESIAPADQPISSTEGQVHAMHNDKPLPPLMQDWMTGTLTSQQLIDTIIPHINHLSTEGFFSSEREQRIIRKATLLLLDPQTRCDLYRPIKRGINLMRQCKKLGHKVYLLSNMDTELINLLSAKYPDIFELFDGVIISADVNSMKPSQDIYEYALATYRMDPTRSYFIDDQPENVHAAQQLGITGIICDYKHYKKVTHQLRTLGLLEKPVKLA